MGCNLTEEIWWGNFTVIKLENELVKVTLMPQRGGEIHQLSWKQTRFDFLCPDRPGMPDFEAPTPEKPLTAAENVAFSSFYTLFPNAGQPGTYRDYLYEFHGDIRAVEWTYSLLENTSESITVEFEAASINLPFRLKRQLTLRAGSSRLNFQDEITHTGGTTGQPGERLPYIYGFHPYHAYPLLEEGTILRIGDKEIPLSFPDRGQPFQESSNLESGSKGSIEVFNPRLNVSFRLEYDPTFLKNVWLWFVSEPTKEVYMGALLPCTIANLPGNGIQAAVKNNTALWLEPGQQQLTSWAIQINGQGSGRNFL